MARYGVPYRGSKSRIAQWVVRHIPSAEVFIDIFGGGCAVTHAALLEGRWDRYIVNDLSDGPQLFIDAANGRYANETRMPTRDEFYEQKDSDPYIRYLFSFGNNGRDYIYGREIEDLKVTASRMLVAQTLAERYRLYRKFTKMLFHGKYRNRVVRELEGCERSVSVERLQSLENLQRLQSLQNLQSLQSLQSDYRSVHIPPGSVVYADPPYAGTECGEYGDFDHDAFASWLESCGELVIVSEYTAPRGCIEVARIKKQCSASANGKSQDATEKLFVHESQIDKYRNQMTY